MAINIGKGAVVEDLNKNHGGNFFYSDLTGSSLVNFITFSTGKIYNMDTREEATMDQLMQSEVYRLRRKIEQMKKDQ